MAELQGNYGFAETIQRLEDQIAAQGLRVFARIDHAANARAVGLDLPPATVLIFGNARAGTPLMVKAPAVALDLPLRILVRQETNGVVVSYHDPTAMLADFGLPASAAAPFQGLANIARTTAGEPTQGRSSGSLSESPGG
jgi:uncharacterized protein (DUF302 family)